ncbi:MAG: gluconate 2-dehydrogenase subunit 3 family protein [Pseudomonadota bacterium]
MDRRYFLKITSAGTAATAAATASLPLFSASQQQPGDAGLSDQQWQTLDAVQEHLFPSETDAPGAREVKALHWLQQVFLDDGIDEEHKQFLRSGVAQVDETAMELHHKAFVRLQHAQRETVLRTMEQSKKQGRAWLQEIIRYIFEALLTDPVYGGNPGGAGWRWLQHIPGFPRPPKEKRYFLL